MLVGLGICTILSLIIMISGYQIHIKKRLSLIAGYQEETFIGDKNKLAKLFGIFAYVVGIATFLLPFGLEIFGNIASIIYGVCICGGVIVVLIRKQSINKTMLRKRVLHPDSFLFSIKQNQKRSFKEPY